eukprot:3714328-Karenia_brevis.AAC.1
METSEMSVQKKTLMCAFYIKGHCKKGVHCSFAHGTDELGDPSVGEVVKDACDKDLDHNAYYS